MVTSGVPREIRLRDPVLLVLAGPSGSGKSSWAAQHFAPNQIVSSDSLRAVVGLGESDLAASSDAFAVLHTIVEARCRRKLTTVVETLGFDAAFRSSMRAVAAANGLECHVVVFDTDPELCRRRNRERTRVVPAAVLTAQFTTWRQVRRLIESEPFAGVHTVESTDSPSLRIVAESFIATNNDSSTVPTTTATTSTTTGKRIGVRFGLHLGEFPAKPENHRSHIREVAEAAEAAGFDALWVMDHFRQIPQVGREWDDMLAATSTLGYLAGVTTRVTLGSLVHCVTHRNIAVLGKEIATLDVLSGGRAVCGLGIGWHEKEHAGYGLQFASTTERYELLEDALQFLPLLWGKGSPSFVGRRFSASEATCYPRPLQPKIPILVGGSGEKRTLALVAQYADACNFFGDIHTVRRKLDVLNGHCAAASRDRASICVTHLSTALVGRNPGEVTDRVERLRLTKRTVNAHHPGTIEDHVVRVRNLAAAGVDQIIVRLPKVSPDDVTLFGKVIDVVRSAASP